MATSNVLRGALFFSWFLPSFTKLGYKVRNLTWQKQQFSFEGQTWLITGASTGIGREIARTAANAGAHVHVVARSEDKLQHLVAEIQPNSGTIIPHCNDLSLMSEVEKLTDKLATQEIKINVLVNNVGLMLNEYSETAEGFETGFATNLLSHYRLTEALITSNALVHGATVINMSSGGMYNVPLDIAELQNDSHYDGTLAYAYHKRAQVALNAYCRQRYLGRFRSYVMHPGWVSTPGVETAMPEFHQAMGGLLRGVDAGADTALWLVQERPLQATDDGIWFDRALRSGYFFSDTRKGAMPEDLVAYLTSPSTAFIGDLQQTA